MRNIFMVVVLSLMASVAFAGNPHNCPPGHQNIGSCAGEPFPDGYGGDFDIDNSSNAVAVGVGVGVANSQSNSNATAGAVATGGNANATGGAGGNANAVGLGVGGDSNVTVGNVSASTGDVTNTNTNTATGGEGGAGGTAVSAAVVEAGAVNVNYEYRQVRQAPSVGQGSFAISGCGVAGNVGGSNSGGAAFLGFGWTPAQCYDFMLAQAYQAVGETKAACEVLNNSKAGRRAKRRGVELPDCEPQYIVVEVPAEVDLSPYATKEALNRAFERSLQNK